MSDPHQRRRAEGSSSEPAQPRRGRPPGALDKENLEPEVHAFATALREGVFDPLSERGWPLQRIAKDLGEGLSKTTLQRFYTGNRVPSDRELLERILKLIERVTGHSVPAEARAALMSAHLQALRVRDIRQFAFFRACDERDAALLRCRHLEEEIKNLKAALRWARRQQGGAVALPPGSESGPGSTEPYEVHDPSATEHLEERLAVASAHLVAVRNDLDASKVQLLAVFRERQALADARDLIDDHGDDPLYAMRRELQRFGLLIHAEPYRADPVSPATHTTRAVGDGPSAASSRPPGPMPTGPRLPERSWERNLPRPRIRLGTIFALCVAAAVAIWGATSDVDLSKLPLPPFLQSKKQVVVHASGQGPWSVSGYGWTYTVESVARTTSEWQFKKRPSLTVTAYVERSSADTASSMKYRISDQDSGTALDTVPFQGGGDGTPPLHQRSRLVHVVWDSNPQATHLTFTLHDFYWPEGRDLVLQDIPVPSGT